MPSKSRDLADPKTKPCSMGSGVETAWKALGCGAEHSGRESSASSVLASAMVSLPASWFFFVFSVCLSGIFLFLVFLIIDISHPVDYSWKHEYRWKQTRHGTLYVDFLLIFVLPNMSIRKVKLCCKLTHSNCEWTLMNLIFYRTPSRIYKPTKHPQ